MAEVGVGAARDRAPAQATAGAGAVARGESNRTMNAVPQYPKKNPENQNGENHETACVNLHGW